jgi:hypothetical protein
LAGAHSVRVTRLVLKRKVSYGFLR